MELSRCCESVRSDVDPSQCGLLLNRNIDVDRAEECTQGLMVRRISGVPSVKNST